MRRLPVGDPPTRKVCFRKLARSRECPASRVAPFQRVGPTNREPTFSVKGHSTDKTSAALESSS